MSSRLRGDSHFKNKFLIEKTIKIKKINRYLMFLLTNSNLHRIKKIPTKNDKQYFRMKTQNRNF